MFGGMTSRFDGTFIVWKTVDENPKSWRHFVYGFENMPSSSVMFFLVMTNVFFYRYSKGILSAYHLMYVYTLIKRHPPATKIKLRGVVSEGNIRVIMYF